MDKRFKIPAITEFPSYRPFLSAFYRENKAERSSFSFRYIASRLQWPTSFFSDVVYGKRELSMKRALEFSRWVGFDAVKTDYFIKLVLAESKDPVVREYFSTHLPRLPSDNVSAATEASELA
ncbi:MAG: hypothetical protein AB7P04_08980 [Bacteriovoracia bacterium]